MTDTRADILTPLASLGWSTDQAHLETLAGGVSSATILVRVPGREPVVVKQALARLAVQEEWLADPTRAVAEGHALDFLHTLTPTYVPRPIAVIEHPPTAVLPLAPHPSTDWRVSLLNEPRPSDVDIAVTLRGVADSWHSAPIEELAGSDLDDLSRVTSLRIDPFYRGMAEIWPHFAGVILESAQQLLDERISIVHGDFTPKNVLVHSQGIWVIDAEVCHVGNPLLDTASMSTHLLLKSVRHRQTHAQTMADIRQAFLPISRHSASLARHVGVILGVRAVGRSPAGYLSDEERRTVTSMAEALLEGASLVETESQWLSP